MNTSFCFEKVALPIYGKETKITARSRHVKFWTQFFFFFYFYLFSANIKYEKYQETMHYELQTNNSVLLSQI